MKRSVVVTLASLAVVSLVVACSSAPIDDNVGGDDGFAPATGGGAGGANGNKPAASDGGATAPKEGGAGTCGSNAPTVDVSGFPKCMDGGRCVPAAAIPADQQSRLNTCPNNGYCVPEIFLATGGNYVPKSCTSLASGEGRCLSRLFKDIDAQKDQLPKDVCEESERCAPCYDPTSGSLTGACNLVSCDAPKKPKVVFKDCCLDSKSGKPGGRCVPKSLIPAANQGDLETKECNKATELCAPAEQLDPKFVPPKCKASAILGNYDGVCISDCVHKDFFAGIGTAQGNCGAGTFCAPCKNPLTGASTGAPGCAP